MISKPGHGRESWAVTGTTHSCDGQPRVTYTQETVVNRWESVGCSDDAPRHALRASACTRTCLTTRACCESHGRDGSTRSKCSDGLTSDACLRLPRVLTAITAQLTPRRRVLTADSEDRCGACSTSTDFHCRDSGDCGGARLGQRQGRRVFTARVLMSTL